jgi:hypothetical protein
MLLDHGRTWLTAVIPLVAALSTVGCSGDQAGDITGPSGGAGGGNLSSASVSAADLTFCVSETNRYRTSVGVGELAQAADLEAFALAAARADHASGVEHGYFRANATGLASENMVLRSPFAGNVRSLITAALAAFWAEGPGGVHYDSMRDPRWRRVGCGIHIDGDQATLAQELRP